MSLQSRSMSRCAHLFQLPARQTSVRCLSTTTRHLLPFNSAPAPPRLPKEEQERFEELQRESTGAFSTPQPRRSPPQINQSPHSSEPEGQAIKVTSRGTPELNIKIDVKDDGEKLHPNIRRGAAPEFEGEKNPKTGEVGGPKNDPLRWGDGGDWSYNGRVTDF